MLSISLVLITVVLIVFIIPSIIIRWKYSEELRDSLWWLIKYKGKKLPYSTTNDYGMGKGLIFCPHPFTNWSLNPTYQNRFGEIQHTVEGFRKTQDTNSIKQMIEESPESYRIVCIGGSTTYCYPVDRYQNSWPIKLKEKINRKEVSIFNFGVPHWTTIQSFIRCLTWLPIVKPDLIIFYQAKNDLNALTNSSDEETFIFPDYQNVMAQYSRCLSLKISRWLLYLPLFYLFEIYRLNRLDFWCLYNAKVDLLRLNRLTDEIIKGILFRTEAILNMCDLLKCRVLYIPEVTRNKEYMTALNKIYYHIPEIINKYDNASLFDIRDIMPDNDRFYVDPMHLNEQGCELFAELLSRQILKLWTEDEKVM